MADRVLAEAVADLRLSDRRFAQDLANIRRQLLGVVANLEADATIRFGTTIDPDRLAESLAQVTSVASALGEHAQVPITPRVDTEEADRAVGQFTDRASTTLRDGFQRAGDEAGRQYGSRLSSALTGILGTLGAAAGGFVATALVKGFDRLTTISDATASLTVQLGSAADAASLLDDVLGVVKGTPFNLDQFARAASNMTAFGIAASKIPGYLTAIGEASATRGSQANEVAARLAVVFGQVQAQGRLTGQDVQSFSEAGVNALAILGNAAGKTTTEMRDLISSGVIPAGRALDTLRDGIMNGSTGINGATVAFAGTMANLRNTLTGSIGGFSAATARLGVTIIKPFEELLTKGFSAGTDVLDRLGGRITAAFAGFADSRLFDRVEQFFTDLPDNIDPVLDRLSKLGPLLAPLGAAFGALGLSRAASALGPLGQLIPASLTNPLTAALAAMVAFNPQLRDAFLPLIADAGQILTNFAGAIGPTLVQGVQDLTPALVALVRAFAQLEPLIKVGAEFAATFLGAVVPMLTSFVGIVADIPTGVLETLLTVFLGYKALSFLTSGGGFFQSIATGLTQLRQVSSQRLAIDTAALTGSASREEFQRTLAQSDQIVAQQEQNSGRIATALNRAGVSAQSFQKVIGSVGAAVGGVFAGMALASQDSSTQITGALGGIGAIAAGFATGGGPGAAVAGLGVAIGGIVGYFQRGEEQAKRLQARVDEVTHTLTSNTAEWVKNALATGDGASQMDIAAESARLLNDALINTGKDGDKAKATFVALGIPTSEFLRVITQIGAFGKPDGDLSKVPEAMAALNAQFGPDKAKLVADYISKFGASDALNAIDTPAFQTFAGPNAFGLEDLNASQAALIRYLVSLKELSEHTDTGAIIHKNLVDLIATNDQYAKAAQIVDSQREFIGKDVRNQTKDAATEQAYLVALQDVYVNKQQQILDLRIQDALVAAQQADGTRKYTDAQITAIKQLSAEMGTPILDLVDLGASVEGSLKSAQAAVKDTVTSAEGLIPPLTEAELITRAFVQATDLSKVAMQSAADAAAQLVGNLSATDALANFNAALRDIGTGLDKVTNQSDLDKRPDLTRKIDDQLAKVAQLQADVTKEQGDADAKAQALQVQLQSARAAGALGGVALIQRELATVNDKADKKRTDLASAQADLADFRGELAKLSSSPITLRMILVDQAGKAHLSLFELLEQGLTPESLSEGEKVRGAIRTAVGQITDTAQREGPAAAAQLARTMVGTLRDGFVADGLDQATADELVAKYFDVDRLVSQYQSAIDAAGVKARASDAFTKLIQPDIAASLATVKTTLDTQGPQAAEEAALAQRAILIKAFTERGFPNPAELVDQNFDAAGIITRIEDQVRAAAAGDAVKFPIQFDFAAGVLPDAAPLIDQVAGLIGAGLGNGQSAALSAAFGATGSKLSAIMLKQALTVPITPALANVDTFMTEAQKAFNERSLVVKLMFTPDLSLLPAGVDLAQLFAQPTGATPRQDRSAGIGGLIALKEGGIVSFLGGRPIGRGPEDHTAQIVPAGTWRLLAEPETGGEGYVPLAPEKREKSTQVLRTIADLFGLQVLPKMAAPAALQVTINPGFGAADADVLGRAIARHVVKSPGQVNAEAAERYDRAVHVGPGAIVVHEAREGRRTAHRLVSALADLAFVRPR